MTKILALSAKKQGGKTTTANWIIGQQLMAVNAVSYANLDEKGRLIVPSEVNGKIIDGIFDPMAQNPEAQALLAHFVWPVVKLYSFATILKLSAAAIFGLDMSQVDGTNEEKDAPTQLKWSNFTDFLSFDTHKHVETNNLWNIPVSGRNILQIMGTDIFRRIYNDVWVEACLSNIKNDDTELAIITDCRFPNEVEGVQKAGGKVIRFLRAPFAGEDEHTSETALDNYPEEKFDHVFDNRELTIHQQCVKTNELLTKWGYNTWEWEIGE